MRSSAPRSSRSPSRSRRDERLIAGVLAANNEANLKIHCDVDGDVQCQSDERMIEIVFEHLLNNIRWNRQERPDQIADEVEIRIKKVRSNVNIKFSYHAKGIPKKVQNQIPDTFIFSGVK